MRLLRHHAAVFRIFLAACLISVLLATAQAAPLSPTERSKLFEQVWQLIRDHYYDPNLHGLDWNGIHQRYRDKVQNSTSDEAVYATLKQMTGELRDAHTRFKSPAERRRAMHRVATTTGVMIGDVAGAPTVMDVEPGSDADRSGVQPGMVLASVDGQPAAQRLAEIQRQAGISSSERATALLGYFRLLDGAPGSLVRVQFLKADNTTLDVVLRRHTVSMAPRLTTRMLPQGFVYIRVPLFEPAFSRQAAATLSKHRTAPGVILDLRGNPGGNFSGVLKLADEFFSRRVSFGRVTTRSGRSPSFILRIFGVPAQLEAGHEGHGAYAGPVAILVNEGSGSGAEIFAAGMQENHRAAIIGRQSCGCVLGSVPHKVKGGAEVDVSEFAIATSKDKRLEGVGVVPDIAVPLTLADLREHRDSALEQAIEILRKSTSR